MKKENSVQEKKKETILGSIISYVVIFAVVFAFFRFVVTLTLVVGPSMEPTYHNSDLVMFTRIGYTPEVDDVVIFRGHENYEGVTLIKRVAAVPGDEVDVDGATGVVTVNGKVIVTESEGIAIQEEDIAAFPATVPDGCYFVLGDNYKVSEDSRYAPIGMVPRSDILGEMIFSIKLSRIGG